MASPRQTLTNNPPQIGLLFGDINPDKVRDGNAIVGLPSFWPFAEAVKSAIQYLKNHSVVESQFGARFYLQPPNGDSLDSYAEHLVAVDGNKITANTKLKGLRSIHQTLNNPSFCLDDTRLGSETYLYCRVYKNGEIHVVVVDPVDLRVKTQYLFNDKDGSTLLGLKIVGVRGDWPELK